LDLDNTLISTTEQPTADYDFEIPVYNKKSRSVQMFYIKKRPFLDEFLQVVSKYFEVILFSAAQAQ